MSKPVKRAAARPPVDMVVKADADKLFFIDMLVKDIELVPAVLDLVDNSVDGARSVVFGADPELTPTGDLPDEAFDGYFVRVTATAEQFVIEDNCGGIELKIARDYAFRFGRSKQHHGTPGSVGQFGVGMKRALFKLGREFRVTSRAAATSFDLVVDVAKWAADTAPEWTFPLKAAQEGLPEPDAFEAGTTVTVSRLHDSVEEDLDDPLVLGQLREQLRLRHQAAIDRGLEVRLNGERLKGLRPRLLSGPSFRPVNKTFALREKDGDVFVRLIAGVAAPDRKDASLNDAQAEDFRTPGDAGWWLFCNERLLLVADRTFDTGWGSAGANYHPQYRGFRGYVYLTALNTALLPWNTTKTGVDQDSRVWRQVQSEMKTALVSVQAVINRLKREGEEAEDPDGSADGGDGDGDAPYTKALRAAKPTALSDLAEAQSVVVPPVPAQPRRRRTTKKIQYEVPLDQFEEIAEVVGTTNTAEIGRRTFNYFYAREVED
jgi:hypothetical protein